jgi:hypothetical protein
VARAVPEAAHAREARPDPGPLADPVPAARVLHQRRAQVLGGLGADLLPARGHEGQAQQQILDIYFKHVADNIEAFRKKKKESSGGNDGKAEPVQGIPGIKVENFEDREKVEKILSEAVDKAFEGIDLEALDKDFRAWIDSL